MPFLGTKNWEMKSESPKVEFRLPKLNQSLLLLDQDLMARSERTLPKMYLRKVPVSGMFSFQNCTNRGAQIEQRFGLISETNVD